MMPDQRGAVLPYRTTGEELSRWIEARARGRDLAQIQGLNFAAGGFQGTLVAGQALGFVDPETQDVSLVGREFALAPDPERRRLIFESLLRYEPYELLIEAVFDRGNATETTLEWVQTWWSTQGYGSSQTNREEASSAFAKLAEYAGLGSYLQGRRGYPTRIQWSDGAGERAKEVLRASESPRSTVEEEAEGVEAFEAIDFSAPAALGGGEGPAGGNSRLVLNLGAGRAVELSFPPYLSAEERKRLLALVELMLTATPGDPSGGR